MNLEKENEVMPSGFTRLEEHSSRILASMMSACDSHGNLRAINCNLREEAVIEAKELISVIYPSVENDGDNDLLPSPLRDSKELMESLSIRRMEP